MTWLSRDEIRRRALRAAAAVALSCTSFACGDTPVTTLNAPPISITAGADAGPTLPSDPDAAGSAQEAGETSDVMILAADAGEMPDAGAVDCSNAPDFVACCAAVHWDVAKGCEAWGPPVPPAWRASEVA
jgi:hypothetical protein